MNLTLLDDADVKVVYDSQGVKREVLISYEKYKEMLAFIKRYAYFYSQDVQERLQKSDEDLQAGRYIRVEAAEVDKALGWLNECIGASFNRKGMSTSSSTWEGTRL